MSTYDEDADPGEPQHAPGDREQLAAELDALMAEYPPGSAGYLNKHVQKRVADLHRAIAGDRPLVGTRGRTL